MNTTVLSIAIGATCLSATGTGAMYQMAPDTIYFWISLICSVAGGIVSVVTLIATIANTIVKGVKAAKEKESDGGEKITQKEILDIIDEVTSVAKTSTQKAQEAIDKANAQIEKANAATSKLEEVKAKLESPKEEAVEDEAPVEEAKEDEAPVEEAKEDEALKTLKAKISMLKEEEASGKSSPLDIYKKKD